jgi:hypothetical protein
MRFISLTLCLLLSCDAAPIERQVRPILNGVPDPGHSAIGTLAGGAAFCTATLLGARTVLVAAHCLQDKASYTFTLGAQSFSDGIMSPQVPSGTMSAFPHPTLAESL